MRCLLEAERTTGGLKITGRGKCLSVALVLLFCTLFIAGTKAQGLELHAVLPADIPRPRLKRATLYPYKTNIPGSPAAGVRMALPEMYPTAFFCRLELQFARKTGWPVLFRLGSVDYNEVLEGKRRQGPAVLH